MSRGAKAKKLLLVALVIQKIVPFILETQMNRMQKTSFLFGAVLITASIHAANAASFDCKKASGVTENAICSDAELSELDNVLAKSYADARSKFSVEGKNAIKAEQINWLKKQMNCSSREITTPKERVACLKTEYKSRIGELNRRGTPRNGVLIYRALAPLGDDTCLYDQIDSQEPFHKQLNLMAKKKIAIWDICVDSRYKDEGDHPVSRAWSTITPLTKNLFEVATGFLMGGQDSLIRDDRYYFIKSDKQLVIIGDIFNPKRLNQLSQLLLTEYRIQSGDNEYERNVDEVVNSLEENGVSVDAEAMFVDITGCPILGSSRCRNVMGVSWNKLMPYLTDAFKAEVAKFK